MTWLLLIMNPLLVLALSPFYVGVIRKMKARLQNRQGASLLQPYRDLAKLFHKDEVISEDASWIFRAAPYIVFATTAALSAGIPLISPWFAFLPMADLLVIVYTLALGVFFLALAGIDVGHPFGAFGASREMMISALAEGGLILSLVVAAFLAQTTNVVNIAFVLSSATGAALLPLALAGISFFIALLAENARFPVDNPATHLELTMVHEAMILEYSGKRLALMEWAAANKLLLFAALFVNIFIPVGMAWHLTVPSLVFGMFWVALKLFAVAVIIALIESVIAKFRIFRIPDLLFTSLVLSIIAILAVTL